MPSSNVPPEPSSGDSIGERKAFVFISVGSPLFSGSWLETFLSSVYGHYSPTFIFMDSPEHYNLVVFESLDESSALVSASERTERLIIGLSLDRHVNCEVWRWHNIEVLPRYPKYRTSIVDYYGASGAFRRHCQSQVFSNLRPQMKAAGIRTKSDPRVASLVPYLLEEIAAKLCLTQEAIFHAELLLRPEMDIMNAIYDGKYSHLTGLIQHRPKMRKLAPQLIAADYWNLA